MKKNLKIILAILTCIPISSSLAITCGKLSILRKPILFNQHRIELTRQYRLEHYGIQSKSITIVPKMIVLHWTSTTTLQQAFDLLYPTEITNRPEISKYGKLNVSAHYLVDRDGTIYQLMPDNYMARHVIGLNNIAIGIENVGGVNNKPDLTKAQLKSNICLVKYLEQKYPTINYVIGHYEYVNYRNTPLWQEKNPGYITPKKDPGTEFMREVRKALE